MTDRAEFLLARIDEDEAWARARLAEVPEWRNPAKDLGGVPVRILAECEAKRRIVERYRVCEPHYDEGNRLETRVLDWTMRLLALPYADHEDYDPEWKP